MRPLTHFALHSIIAAGLIAFAATGAAAAAYIKYGSIKGESAHRDGKVGDGWIEIQDWSWGMSNAPQAGSGATREASLPSVSEMTAAKPTGRSSTELMKPLAQGSLTVRMPAGQCIVGARHPTASLETEYVRYEMENIMVSSCFSSGQSGGDSGSRPTESVSLNYGKISMTYLKQDKSEQKKVKVRAWDPQKKEE